MSEMLSWNKEEDLLELQRRSDYRLSYLDKNCIDYRDELQRNRQIRRKLHKIWGLR